MSSFHSSNKATPSTTIEADSTAVIRILFGPNGQSFETEEAVKLYQEQPVQAQLHSIQEKLD